ncbi:MAG TPA: UDP-N-acetylmuramoyl-L-alanyl-D-glutamate--2,6-diaminopimelate ligase [Anaerolineae bacterium]|nr:UDP-N-acetylmuramoyl-L-alanyl-D-glutamate--2,6-diaminopimelate ligase [Anaerolineae bacterium]
MSPLLTTLLQALPGFSASDPLPAMQITLVTADSRQVQPGALFVAVRGGAVDGHRFIADAIRRGAAAVVGMDALTPETTEVVTTSRVPYVRVDDSRAALARLAAAFFGYPSRQMRVVGVTGTDGKTTTSNLIYHLLGAAGLHPGMISTIGAHIGQEALDTGLHVTTPDAPDVQRYLAQMAAAGCQAAVLEATSHGLHQGRVAAVDFDVAVVTNITHEHLDYHGTWQAYLQAKALLFHSLKQSATKPVAAASTSHVSRFTPDVSPLTFPLDVQPKVAVLNADDASYPHLRAIPTDWTISYGLDDAAADVRAADIAFEPARTIFTAHTPAGQVQVELPLPGRFNVYNALAALAAGLALGLPLQGLAATMATMPGVDGRMERIERGQDFVAMVDFAHTPISLQRALEAVRPMTAGRVIALFGSAGLRDVRKRGLMAAASLRLADLTILTAEDPRVESLDVILEQMAEGARQVGGVEGRNFWRIPDRTAAILAAVEMAQPGDVVIVCGKGHEQSMCFGEIEHPWRDQLVLAWALERRLGQSSAPPPFRLPTADPGQTP